MAIIHSTAYYKPKQPNVEEVFNYLCSLISNDLRHTSEIKSSTAFSKAALTNNKPSLQILEEETVTCYM